MAREYGIWKECIDMDFITHKEKNNKNLPDIRFISKKGRDDMEGLMW